MHPDCADYVADSIAVVRSTTSRQSRTHPTTTRAAAANDQSPRTGSHRGGECKCQWENSFGFSPGSGSGTSSRTSSLQGGKGKEGERGDSVNDASGGGAVGRWEDDNGRTVSFLPTYVYDAMKDMRVGFLVFHLVLRFFVLPFCCCFFLSFFPLVLVTKLTPSTYKSLEIPLLSSSGFRMIPVRTKLTSHGNEPISCHPLLTIRKNPLTKYFFALGLP